MKIDTHISALKKSKSMNNCFQLKGDCTKCHYSHYQSLQSNTFKGRCKCKTYQRILELIELGIVFDSESKFTPSLDKYLFLTGQVDRLT